MKLWACYCGQVCSPTHSLSLYSTSFKSQMRRRIILVATKKLAIDQLFSPLPTAQSSCVISKQSLPEKRWKVGMRGKQKTQLHRGGKIEKNNKKTGSFLCEYIMSPQKKCLWAHRGHCQKVETLVPVFRIEQLKHCELSAFTNYRK